MIEVVQFLRPHGRTVILEVELPPEIEVQAQAVIAAGMKFEAEVVPPGLVSLTIAGKDEDGEETDLEIEISPNDERVLEAMNRLVAKGYSRIAPREGA